MNNINLTQFSMEGKKMLRRAFNQFLDPIIYSDAVKRFDCYYLFVDTLSHEDKRMLLSYLVDIEDFEDYTKNPTREREAFKEYKFEMQVLIDMRIDEIAHEIDEAKSRRYDE